MGKKDVLLLQYSERLKSELIIGMKLVSALENLKDKEFEGGSKIVSQFFEAFGVEVGIAYNATKDERFKEVHDIVSNVDFLDVENAIEKLGRAMSIITTCAMDAYTNLQNSGIL